MNGGDGAGNLIYLMLINPTTMNNRKPPDGHVFSFFFFMEGRRTLLRINL